MCEMHVWEMHVWEMQVLEMHVWEMHVLEMHVWEMHVWEMRVWEMHVWEMHVWEMHVWEMHVYEQGICSITARTQLKMVLDLLWYFNIYSKILNEFTYENNHNVQNFLVKMVIHFPDVGFMWPKCNQLLTTLSRFMWPKCNQLLTTLSRTSFYPKYRFGIKCQL